VLEQLLLNTRVHLRFYARNRLLLGFGLVMLLLLGLTMVPMLLFGSSSDRFNALHMITGVMSGYAMVFVASLGLFAISSHLRHRNVKLVLTKPCLPEVWLASIFVAALLIAIAIYTMLAAAAAILSWIWGIPWQWGFLFVAVDGACRALIQMALLTCLSTAVHPVMAVLIALFFNEGIFFGLKTLIAGALQARSGKAWLVCLRFVCDALYIIMPMAQPFSQHTESVYSSLRASGTEWLYLGGALGYTAVLSAFFFLICDYLLRRKNLI